MIPTLPTPQPKTGDLYVDTYSRELHVRYVNDKIVSCKTKDKEYRFRKKSFIAKIQKGKLRFLKNSVPEFRIGESYKKGKRKLTISAINENSVVVDENSKNRKYSIEDFVGRVILNNYLRVPTLDKHYYDVRLKRILRVDRVLLTQTNCTQLDTGDIRSFRNDAFERKIRHGMLVPVNPLETLPDGQIFIPNSVYERHGVYYELLLLGDDITAYNITHKRYTTLNKYAIRKMKFITVSDDPKPIVKLGGVYSYDESDVGCAVNVDDGLITFLSSKTTTIKYSMFVQMIESGRLTLTKTVKISNGEIVSRGDIYQNMYRKNQLLVVGVNDKNVLLTNNKSKWRFSMNRVEFNNRIESGTYIKVFSASDPVTARG